MAPALAAHAQPQLETGCMNNVFVAASHRGDSLSRRFESEHSVQVTDEMDYMVDLDKFLNEQLEIARSVPERVKSAFDRSDLKLTEALDITASINKSVEYLDAVLLSVDREKLDEPMLNRVKLLQRVWKETYILAQVGSDRLMSK